MAPDLERLARTPCPIARCASSGTRLFNSALARSCSRKAGCVRVNAPANSAQALEALISTVRTATIRGFGGSTPKRVGVSSL
jgi:glycine cleavage system regulatory protein